EATVWYSDGSAANVQALVNIATDGDTVTVPAGSFTWPIGVTITNKSLQLVGAGIDQTIITRNTVSDYTPALTVILRPVTTDTFYMSGFTWRTVNNPASGIVNVGNTDALGQPVCQFRITNCKFTHTPTNGGNAQGARSIIIYASYGLIDHCTFV